MDCCLVNVQHDPLFRTSNKSDGFYCSSDSRRCLLEVRKDCLECDSDVSHDTVNEMLPPKRKSTLYVRITRSTSSLTGVWDRNLDRNSSLSPSLSMNLLDGLFIINCDWLFHFCRHPSSQKSLLVFQHLTI